MKFTKDDRKMSPREIFEKLSPKYLGDEYILLFDTLHNDSPIGYMYQRAMIGLEVNQKLFAYLNGTNRALIADIAFHKAVNKVYRKDPEKYKTIWTGQDPKYPDERRIKLGFEKHGEQEAVTTPKKPMQQMYG